MVRHRCNYFSFWDIFCPFTPVTAQKIKISQKRKRNLEISSFYIYVPKIMTDDVWFLRYGVQQTDGWTEKVTYRGGCST